MDGFQDPSCVEIDANDTMYVCDHHNYRVQMWPKGASTGIKIIDTTGADHPEALTFDKNNYLYLTGHDEQRVVRFTPYPSFSSLTIVAGVTASSGSTLNKLNNPYGMDLDDNLNLYVAERGNKRVVKWPSGASSGSIVVSGSKEFYGLVLSRFSTNQVYVSSEEGNAVYLWTFNASSASVTLTAVDSSTSTLKKPRGLQYDIYNNLYVADRDNNRVVMYCPNATVGRVAVASSSLKQPYDVAFDSDLNMYVVDGGTHNVIKFNRL